MKSQRDGIESGEIRALPEEVVKEVIKSDPVRGPWSARGDEATSTALRVEVEFNESIVEDASWLSKDDSCHMNMAALDAVIKGMNFALAWVVKKMEVVTDSSTVHR